MNISNFRVDIESLFFSMTEQIFVDPTCNPSTKLVIDGVNSHINDLLEMVDQLNGNFSELTDKEYMETINRMCVTILDDCDYMHILNSKNKTNYDKIGLIKTQMEADLSTVNPFIEYYFYNAYFIVYKVLYSTSANIDFNHFYSISELRKLIQEKKIFIIGIGANLLLDKDIKLQKYYDFPVCDVENFMRNKVLRKYVIKYLRENITINELRHAVKLYGESINQQITNLTDAEDKFQYEVDYGKRCLSDLKKSGTVRKLERIMKDLS